MTLTRRRLADTSRLRRRRLSTESNPCPLALHMKLFFHLDLQKSSLECCLLLQPRSALGLAPPRLTPQVAQPSVLTTSLAQCSHHLPFHSSISPPRLYAAKCFRPTSLQTRPPARQPHLCLSLPQSALAPSRADALTLRGSTPPRRDADAPRPLGPDADASTLTRRRLKAEAPTPQH